MITVDTDTEVRDSCRVLHNSYSEKFNKLYNKTPAVES